MGKEKTNMLTWADSRKVRGALDRFENRGIDPKYVVGEDGKRYLLLSSGALYPLSDDGCSITGEPQNL